MFNIKIMKKNLIETNLSIYMPSALCNNCKSPMTRSSATAEKQRVRCPHSAPSLPMFPLEFCGEVKRAGN